MTVKNKITIMVLILWQVACGSSVVTVTPKAEQGARPAERPLLAEKTIRAGSVVVESVYVRESGDLSAPVVGFLALGAVVLPLECVSVGVVVWVRHAQGWTVVRNRSAEYVAGVCNE